MSSWPHDKELKYELTSGRTLEDVIDKFKNLREFVENNNIPPEIRRVADDEFLKYNFLMNYGSIPRYEQLIRELEEEIIKNPSLRDHWNKSIQEHKRTIANMERARRVAAGAER